MNIKEMTPASAARWAGIGYAVLFVLAIVANFVVREQLVVADDPSATMANIANNATTFRIGVAVWIAIMVIDILIAWALHVTFRFTGERRSLLAAWMRLAYSVLLGAAASFMAVAGQVATDDGRFGAIATEQREAWTAVLLAGFDAAWLIGLVAFGLHLLVIARLMLTSRVGPRGLGVVLAVAGAAYVADSFVHMLVADYSAVASVTMPIVAVASIAAELWFTLWLLVRAPKAVSAEH